MSARRHPVIAFALRSRRGSLQPENRSSTHFRKSPRSLLLTVFTSILSVFGSSTSAQGFIGQISSVSTNHFCHIARSPRTKCNRVCCDGGNFLRVSVLL